MNSSNDLTILFHSCSTLQGRTERIGVGKRNGRPIPLLAPGWTAAVESEPPADWIDDPRFYINLNDVERRTWRAILSAFSIKAIAQEEGVSRAAIYARIVGNGHGYGGMIGKNVWVLIWWRLRQRMTGGPQ